MNQLIAITILFCASFTVGLSQTPTVLRLNNKVQVTFPDLYKESTMRNPAVRQVSGAIVELQMKGILNPK